MRVRQAPASAVLLVVGAGLVVVDRGYWRTGAGTIALGLLLAATLRVVLPPRYAGWLVVRTRVVDAALLLGTGAAVLALAITIPHPS